MLRLPGNLACLARLAGKDSSRYALTALRLRETTEGYEVVATDGHRLAVVSGPGLCDEPVPTLDDAPNGVAEALVPAADFGRVLKGARHQSAFAVLGPETTTFAVGHNLSRVPHEEGRFPDVNYVVAHNCRSLLQVKVHARMLAELLLVAAEFGSDGPRDAAVTLHYGGKDVPLLVTTENHDGQQFQAAMMPLT